MYSKPVASHLNWKENEIVCLCLNKTEVKIFALLSLVIFTPASPIFAVFQKIPAPKALIASPIYKCIF